MIKSLTLVEGALETLRLGEKVVTNCKTSTNSTTNGPRKGINEALSKGRVGMLSHFVADRNRSIEALLSEFIGWHNFGGNRRNASTYTSEKIHDVCYIYSTYKKIRGLKKLCQ
jgi:hypothetical protein